MNDHHENGLRTRGPRRLTDAEIAALANEVAQLRAEVAYLRGSRAFNLGRKVQWRLALFDLPLLTTGVAVGLLPGQNVHSKGDAKGTSVWLIDGDDPQFLLELGRSLPPGHYTLSMDLPDRDLPPPLMHLYVDSGGGYREVEKLDLIMRPAGGMRYATTISLHQGAERLRLDPSPVSSEITIGSIRFRRQTRPEFYCRSIAQRLSEYQRVGRPLHLAANAALRVLASKGVRGLAAAVRKHGGIREETATDYLAWIARRDKLGPEYIDNLRLQLKTLPQQPLISVLMPVYDTPEPLLREAIESVRSQFYENWELCIADDCSDQPHVAPLLREFANQDARIKVVFRASNGHISRASNAALELAAGEWVALLDHDDVLRPHALAEVVLEITRHPDAQLIYSDEDKIDGGGRRFDPHFKPDFSRELFRSQNYLNHLTVHRKENIRAVGGWRPGFEGSQDYDLNLRVCERIAFKNIRHIPRVLYHWRAAEGSTALAGSEKGYAHAAGKRALEEHVQRMRLPATVENVPETPFYRLHFRVPEPSPLVSLIVPTRDRVDLLHGCVESIRQKTSYPNYEIVVVDNGSTEPEAVQYLEQLQKTEQVRVLQYEKPFNFSAINNFAVSHARGSIVGMINNDIEVISPDWLTEMVSWAVQSDIGCVGAKLYYPDDTIQHAGVILGIGGVAGHAHLHHARSSPGYFGRAMVVSNCSAVTGACLLIRKSVYEEVEGLDAQNLAVAFNDVDFCLRVRDRGYLNVWTPHAELYHHESASRGTDESPERRGRFVQEVNYMVERWGDSLERDPYYSVNLSRTAPAFSLLG